MSARERAIDNGLDTRVQELEEIRSNAKQLHELIVAEKFTVQSVVAQSEAITIRPEIRIGGRSPRYNTGFTSNIILTVAPVNQDIPVRELRFEGPSIVKAGDYIRAQIPRYTKRNYNSSLHGTRSPRNRQETFYLDRPFNEQEDAIEIAIILSATGKPIRIDRAVDYESITKR